MTGQPETRAHRLRRYVPRPQFGPAALIGHAALVAPLPKLSQPARSLSSQFHRQGNKQRQLLPPATRPTTKRPNLDRLFLDDDPPRAEGHVLLTAPSSHSSLRPLTGTFSSFTRAEPPLTLRLARRRPAQATRCRSFPRCVCVFGASSNSGAQRRCGSLAVLPCFDYALSVFRPGALSRLAAPPGTNN